MNYSALIAFSSALFSIALALCVVWKERRSVAHVAFAGGMTTLAVESIFSGLSYQASTVEGVVDWQRWRFLASAFLPGLWVLFSLAYGRGNYHEFLRRWRLVLAASFLLPLFTGIFFGEDVVASPSESESGRWLLQLNLPGILLNILLLVGAVLVLTNLERTFRAAVGVMRWRIKYMILGVGVLFVFRAYTSSQALLFHVADPRLQIVDASALLAGCLLIVRSLFRAGHFEVDIYPSHSFLQHSLTVALAGMYLLILGVFAKVVTYLGGDQMFMLKAFVVLAALVVLAVLLLSDRARLFSRRFVSRHFQRPLYDYRTVWLRFTGATATCVNQADFCQAAAKSMADIFQALSVSVWLLNEQKDQLVLGASTFLSRTASEQLHPAKDTAIRLLRDLHGHREPVEIDAVKTKWAAELRRCHPDEFRNGGKRVCVPLIAGDEVLGVMLLGDRVGGVDFSAQDFDLLKCIGDQIGAGLLNARLSHKLLEAKELEAFQTMSVFFVHDLKNTANALNLMLQNLPAHFDDPAFRADALRGISRTVAHVNGLIGRLASIRHELQIKAVASDLNEVVGQALSGWEDNADIILTKDLQPLPKVACDPDQILKVFTNLIFNAREAVAQNGRIHLQTRRENGHAVFSVSDTGCGMSQEFIRHSLFRPFQSTKKSGLGVGMFQSKMIVEAHHGRIEVESEPSRGATFRVYLPVRAQSS